MPAITRGASASLTNASPLAFTATVTAAVHGLVLMNTGVSQIVASVQTRRSGVTRFYAKDVLLPLGQAAVIIGGDTSKMTLNAGDQLLVVPAVGGTVDADFSWVELT